MQIRVCIVIRKLDEKMLAMAMRSDGLEIKERWDAR